jgi:hypothetical protein
MAGPARKRRTIAAISVTLAAATAGAWLTTSSLAASAGAPVRPAARDVTTRIPAGWAAVPYRRARLSVPGKWLVEASSDIWCGPGSSSMIFAGIRPVIPRGTGCTLTANYAWIRPAGQIPTGISDRKPTKVINGFPVYRLRTGKDSILYLVPELGVRVGAHGPMAKRILATLNKSALAVVLAKGPVSTVPAHWTWHQFGGVKFAAPAAWHLSHEKRWATCGTGQWADSLLLINAVKPPLALPCPAWLPYASAIAAQPGLTVVTGKYAARSVGEKFTKCQVRDHARICLATVTGSGGFLGGVLIFTVSRPHHKPSAYFLLGLSGAGARPRAVFDSLTLP